MSAFVHTGAAIGPAEQASVPLLDHGFLFGDSVYDVIRTANGRLFMAGEHLDRLRRSAAMIYLELPWSDEEIQRRLGALQERIDAAECYFRVIATRGPGPLSLSPEGCLEPGLYLFGRELIRYPERMYVEGCRVAVVRRLRNDPRALDPRAKTGNYLNNMLGMIEARRAGADDAVFLNAEGQLTEATTSNLWIVDQGRVLTPRLAEGLLAGITRDWAFQALDAAGIEVEQSIIGRNRFDAADEVFVSGTVKGIMPVTVVDGRLVGDGAPGPVTRRVAALYEAALAGN